MITSFTGLPGSGKTLSMTMQGYEYWKETKVPVFANYSIRFPINNPKTVRKIDWSSLKKGRLDVIETQEKQEWYYPPLLSGDDFLEAFKQVDNALFLIDEAGTVFDNRSWKKFQKWMMARFRESRHSNLEIMYTAQNIGDVDLKLRQLTNFMVKCEFVKLFGKWDILLKNPKYHQDVIKSDNERTRKEFLAGNITYLKPMFKKFYKYYNTYEKLIYEIPPNKDLATLIKKNHFETGEYL